MVMFAWLIPLDVRRGQNFKLTHYPIPGKMDAAGVYATVGEIADCLRGVFGEYREV